MKKTTNSSPYQFEGRIPLSQAIPLGLQHVMAFCKRAVLSSAKPASAVSPHAPITMIRGVRFPMNIALCS